MFEFRITTKSQWLPYLLCKERKFHGDRFRPLTATTLPPSDLVNKVTSGTCYPTLAVSRIVFSNEVKFLRSRGSQGKSFIFSYWFTLTGLRFPGPAQVSGDVEVPSLFYYDKCGNVRVAGVKMLIEGIVKIAVTEGWAKTEWLVINYVSVSRI